MTREELTKEKLMRYLPQYYEEVKEANIILGTEAPELELLWQAVSQVKDNQFILAADVITIRKWEKLLQIRSDETQSLDRRKAIVLMELSTKLPLTYRWLENKLLQVVGKDKYSCFLDHNKYALNVCLIDDVNSLMTDLKHYLRRIIPANLVLETATETNLEEDVLIRCAGIIANPVCETVLPSIIFEEKFEKDINIILHNHLITETILPVIKF